MDHTRPTDPRTLPEFRADIVADRTLWELITALGQTATDFEDPQGIRDCLRDATLWWIGADCCQLLAAAAPTMPPVTLTVDIVADLSGFAFLERPMVGLAADIPDLPIRFDIIQWLPIMAGGLIGISTIMWRILPDRQVRPLGRSDWPFGFTTDQMQPGIPDQVARSMIEDRQLVAALWQLSSQPNITDRTDVRPDRAGTRRLTRRGQHPAPVRLIHLNHTRRRAQTSGQTGDREYSCQWVVKPHWRQQAYGPGRALRRATYIDQYVKGPEGKPFRTRDIVKVWDQPT